MFCHKCGEKILAGSSFCVKCGTKTNQNKNQEANSQNQVQEEQPSEPTPQANNTTTNQNQNSTPPLQQTNKTSKAKSKIPYLIPLVSFILVAAILAFTFISEQKKNETVLELQKSAEQAALAGNYEEAIGQLNEALDIRADYEVLQLNIDEITRATDFLTKLEQVKTAITNQDFDQAEQDLATLKGQISTDNSPLFANFHTTITEEEEKITIGKIKAEVANLTSVDALASQLGLLESMSSPEAEKIRAEILEKIVEITNTEATDFLANQQFAEALNAVNKALSYISNDEKLLSLKEEIEQEKVAYEEKASEEDLHNRTAAVEFTAFVASLEENGDIFIEGTIKSVATVPIYTIIVYFAVYDTNGTFLEEGYVHVEPDLLNPGDEGYFSALIPGINQEAQVEIFNVTWYFDQE